MILDDLMRDESLEEDKSDEDVEITRIFKLTETNQNT
jgi:hypothetical protein